MNIELIIIGLIILGVIYLFFHFFGNCRHKWKKHYDRPILKCSKCGLEKCIHKYEIMNTVKILHPVFKTVQKVTYTSRCVHCGNIKKDII